MAELDRRQAPHRSTVPDPPSRHWVYVPYDQLTHALGPLSRHPPEEVGIVLVETPWKGRRRPYHKQKLALILANQRHFALEQAARGVAVDYRMDRRPYAAVLRDAAAEHGPLVMMEAAERELRVHLSTLVAEGLLQVEPHEGWLATPDDLAASQSGPPWRQDTFYRHLRRTRGILMEPDGAPTGGRWSFDADNRKPWHGDPPAPEPPVFQPDPVTTEVLEFVAAAFPNHPGRLDGARLPVTAADARTLWAWARRHALPHFGPFEDAMSSRSRTLFHTRISPLLNLHRLLAADVVADVEHLEVEGELVPLQCREGFIRQVLGWREFVRLVHVETDGFRTLSPAAPIRPSAGDAGWWSRDLAAGSGPRNGSSAPEREAPGKPSPSASPAGSSEAGAPGGTDNGADADGEGSTRALASTPASGPASTPASSPASTPASAPDPEPDGGAAPSHLGASTPLPPAWWGRPSGLACLDHAVAGVLEEGWVHHIPRLMVLSNLATLLDVEPRELTDWFWAGFVDAFDWVVEPNVLAMGTFGTGPVMTTKPYVSGTPYIRKMGDHCPGCALDPDDSCPISDLYWAFLERHREVLEGNRRLALPLASAGRRSPGRKAADAQVFQAVSGALGGGGKVTPDLVERARARGRTRDRARDGPLKPHPEAGP
ncbi:MAG: deoxyribodipyrimidine photolyase [Gemmatimonadales bacterium]|nr:MAG: deoxyribodipyrimidine photolyase [Gemmatimonadales bacterium]